MFSSCEHCKSDAIVFVSHEYVCSSCGVVLLDRMFTDEPEWHVSNSSIQRAELLNPSTYIKDKSVRQITDNIQLTLQLPESICMSGAQLYTTSQNNFKGDNKRYVVTACVFYAQKEMRSGARTREEFCSFLGLDPHKFSKTLSTIKDDMYAQNAAPCRNRIDDTLSRSIYCIADIPTDSIMRVKTTVLKLYDRVREQKEVKCFHVEKLGIALVYMACRILKIAITIKHVADCTETSMATIIKIENCVKHLLTAH